MSTPPVDPADCASCGERIPEHECSKSQRPCGHHCNCVWIHDCCHWCGWTFDPDAEWSL